MLHRRILALTLVVHVFQCRLTCASAHMHACMLCASTGGACLAAVRDVGLRDQYGLAVALVLDDVVITSKGAGSQYQVSDHRFQAKATKQFASCIVILIPGSCRAVARFGFFSMCVWRGVWHVERRRGRLLHRTAFLAGRILCSLWVYHGEGVAGRSHKVLLLCREISHDLCFAGRAQSSSCASCLWVVDARERSLPRFRQGCGFLAHCREPCGDRRRQHRSNGHGLPAASLSRLREGGKLCRHTFPCVLHGPTKGFERPADCTHSGDHNAHCDGSGGVRCRREPPRPQCGSGRLGNQVLVHGSCHIYATSMSHPFDRDVRQDLLELHKAARSSVVAAPGGR